LIFLTDPRESVSVQNVLEDMARRHRLLAPGLHYHVIARGNHREPIFLEDADYRAYLSRLTTYRERYAVSIYAYCLMPNHVHLVVQTRHANLARFMHGLQISYAMRFNRIYAQVGHLFQGRYTGLVCQSDGYLATLVRYVHLNPVRSALVTRPEEYPYSGHLAYLPGAGAGLVDPRPVLALLGGPAGYRRFVAAGLAHAEDEERYLEQADEPSMPAASPRSGWGRHPIEAIRPDLATALDRLAGELGVDPSRLTGPDRTREVSAARNAVAHVLVRQLGYPLAKVAAALGREPATLSCALSRRAGGLRPGSRMALALARLSQNGQEDQDLTPMRGRQRR
jgi:REP element-mobilizing transposase RayT